ncbi:MAG: OB-fold nucleic acid binding domain-containing protein [Candidatus Bathyarchaeota archaeon]|nr:OB-fold nucleic acid binding domain-containing protein [Candidatus Bathyarchaeota archaeon]
MLNRKEIIEKILALRSDLTADDLQRIIRTKIEGAGRLLTEEGATFMVANEFGIDLSNGNVVGTGMKVKDLIIGANDATIVGVVNAVSPPKSFVRRDGVEGQVARLVVSDDTGSVRVVLWNEKTDVISQGKVATNQTVRISHGYVRAGLTGDPELNVGRRGTVVVLSSAPAFERETPQSSLKKIRDLAEGDYFVNFVGVVKGLSQVSSFRRANGMEGQVMRVRLADATGRVRAVLWDDQVDSVKETRRGDVLEIVGGQVRRGLGNVLEVHVGRLGQVKLLKDSELSEYSLPTLTKISGLKLGMNDVDVLGRIMDVGQIREFERRSGGVGRVGSLYVMDETGSTRLTLWDAKADVLDEVSPDDVVLVEGGYTREGLGGVVELNLGSMGVLTVNPEREEVQSLPHFSSNAMAIGDLNVGMRSITVEGDIVEDPAVRDVTTRDGAEIRVASLRIRDESGEIGVTLWRDLADRIDGLGAGTRLRIKNTYVKMGFFGDLELSSGRTTELELLSESEGTPERGGPLINDLATEKIQAVQVEESTEVQGRIMEVNANSKVYPSCPNCMKRVREEERGWMCESCGEIPQQVPRLIVEVIVEDDSGSINSVFSGAVAEKLLNMSSDTAWNLALQAGSEVAPVDDARDRIVGANVQLTGRVVRSRRDGNLRLHVEQLTVL